MWQDAVALLIVALAVLMLVRIYAPGLRIFGKTRTATDSSAEQSYAPGCGGCSGRSTCQSAKK